MNEEESKLVDSFLDVAQENGYRRIVCLTAGFVAFDKRNSAERRIEILYHLIGLAKENKDENDFMEKVKKYYFD